jgi:hypothetical protein
MAIKLSTPRGRTPTLVCPIAPAQLWKELTPAQQRDIRQTLTTLAREWLVTLSPRETTRDE